MGNFVCGFAFAIVTMMTWAAFSEEPTKLEDLSKFITNNAPETFVNAGGYDDKGIGHMLRVNPDGSVNCAK